jgi:hypothetical protein
LDAGTNKRLSQLLRLNLTENPDFAEKLASWGVKWITLKEKFLLKNGILSAWN